MSTPTREIYYGISAVWVMYLLLVPTLAIFFYGYYRSYRRWRLGGPITRLDRISERLRRSMVYVLAQRKLVRDRVGGVAHAFMFWAMIFLFLGTVVVFIHEDLRIHIMQGAFYLYFQSLLLNIAGGLGMLALAAGAFYRYVVRPARMHRSRAAIQDAGDDGIALVWGFLILVQGFAVSGLRIVLTNDPYGSYRFIGDWFGQVFVSMGMSSAAMASLHSYLWWFHLLTAFGWIAWLPYSKLRHVFTAPLAVFFSDLAPKGAPLRAIDLENMEKMGAANIVDFPWKDLLDLDACTECGRCQEVCPAYIADKPLSPKNVILDLRRYLCKAAFLNEDKVAELGPMVGDWIKDETLWSCTTCRACMEQCPVFIEHVPKIVDMRRNLVLAESRFPNELKGVFNNFERNGNPWEISWTTRGDWANGLDIKTLAEDADVEYLYWVGCFASFDERNKKVAVAFSKLLKEAGVSFGILGQEERCTGDAARRAGNEYLFQILAEQNVETLNGYNVKKIVTTCPHCYNTLQNEYPQFGGNYDVVHHSVLLADLIAKGKLKVTGDLQYTITMHDPCYLGRYNDIYDEPRNVLAAIPGVQLKEMERSALGAMCCGGGGARAFMEDHEGRKINVTRVEQAIKVNPDVIGTACPYCMTMFEDAVKTKGVEERIRPTDIAELLAGVVATTKVETQAND